MDEDTKSDLQDHILECANNYGELKAEVLVQNAKIDMLVEIINDMDARQKTAFTSAFCGVVAVV
jgi:hypothetical protein